MPGDGLAAPSLRGLRGGPHVNYHPLTKQPMFQESQLRGAQELRGDIVKSGQPARVGSRGNPLPLAWRLRGGSRVRVIGAFHGVAYSPGHHFKSHMLKTVAQVTKSVPNLNHSGNTPTISPSSGDRPSANALSHRVEQPLQYCQHAHATERT